jgi:hypothetical protein
LGQSATTQHIKMHTNCTAATTSSWLLPLCLLVVVAISVSCQKTEEGNNNNNGNGENSNENGREEGSRNGKYIQSAFNCRTKIIRMPYS